MNEHDPAVVANWQAFMSHYRQLYDSGLRGESLQEQINANLCYVFPSADADFSEVRNEAMRRLAHAGVLPVTVWPLKQTQP